MITLLEYREFNALIFVGLYVCAVCHDLVTLLFSVIGRLYSVIVALPGYLLC